jgi:predicted nuclease of predicted toxin-antitoxin system
VIPRVYLDEDVHAGVAAGLRRRGYDALTTIDAGRSGADDAEQLAFAISQARCLFTFNRGDFVTLHRQVLAAGEHHSGILLCRQVPVGTAVRALVSLLSRRG